MRAGLISFRNVGMCVLEDGVEESVSFMAKDAIHGITHTLIKLDWLFTAMAYTYLFN